MEIKIMTLVAAIFLMIVGWIIKFSVDANTALPILGLSFWLAGFSTGRSS